jgi:hypothetical protein
MKISMHVFVVLITTDCVHLYIPTGKAIDILLLSLSPPTPIYMFITCRTRVIIEQLSCSNKIIYDKCHDVSHPYRQYINVVQNLHEFHSFHAKGQMGK